MANQRKITQDNIILGLRKALEEGSGNIDDLLNLLDSATKDAKTVKEDLARQEEEAKLEAERKRKEEEEARGLTIAQLATRALHNETTADDVATIFNIYLSQHDKNIKLTGEDIEAGWVAGKELGKSLVDLCDSVLELMNAENVDKKPAPAPSSTVKLDIPLVKPTKYVENADEVLKKFLDSIK